MELERLRQAYLHDAQYKHTIDAMMNMVLNLQFSPQELRAMLTYALVRCEMEYTGARACECRNWPLDVSKYGIAGRHGIGIYEHHPECKREEYREAYGTDTPV